MNKVPSYLTGRITYSFHRLNIMTNTTGTNSRGCPTAALQTRYIAIWGITTHNHRRRKSHHNYASRKKLYNEMRRMSWHRRYEMHQNNTFTQFINHHVQTAGWFTPVTLNNRSKGPQCRIKWYDINCWGTMNPTRCDPSLSQLQHILTV